jgi:hypothetical protein
MPLTRLDNLLSSKTGKYIYVSPDDFNATDALNNRGNTPLRPFVTIQRAFLEVARYSYVPGVDNDRFDQFTIMLAPGTHYVDNRPGDLDTSDVPVFNFDANTSEWNDSSILDLSNPNNILYKFNGRDGGATIPRGTSLVGTDLRRTQVRALYVPDPADKDVPRCALFNVTGGCYFWQFTILDGNPESGPLNGKVYSQPGSTALAVPFFSHHKMTNFVFADKEDLSLLYRKIAKCFSKYQTAIDDVYASEVVANGGRVSDTWDASTTKNYAQNDTVVFGGNAYQALSAHASSSDKRPDKNKTYWKILTTISRELEYRIQENRIVGPLADTIQLDDMTISEPTPGLLSVVVKTKINHNLFPGQSVVIADTGFSSILHGSFQVSSISTTNPKEFTYRVSATLPQVSFANGETKVPDASATVQAEVDSVESASPYVFNCSIRSTWGICGIWADGKKATGFKSMVIAQYTGVSLQKDDRAFIRYDEFTNTWNQAPLTDAFSSTPYHIKGDAYWKDDWRNFHVRASDDSFIQNVSIFAVGFADHFLLESGGDMSITNSNSNFGNTSMHSKGFKGFSFNQDKGGYITDIIPPQAFSADATIEKISYYPFDIQLSRGNKDGSGNWLAQPRLYISGDKANTYLSRPAVSINGYKLGARTYINSAKAEKIFTKTSAYVAIGESQPTVKEAYLYPQGFDRWKTSLTTLSPDGLGVGNFDDNPATNEIQDKAFYNRMQDAANLIDANKTFIQAEAFGYIIEKYPYLQNRSYVNPNISSETGRYRDASNLIKANRQEIIDYAFAQMQTAFPTFTVPGGDNTKCKRDIGYMIDAVAQDLYDGGNAATVNAAKAYFGAYASIASVSRSSNVATITTSSAHNLAVGAVVAINCNINEFDNSSATVLSVTSTTFTYSNIGVDFSNTATGTVTTESGSPITNGLVGEETQSVFAFNRARDWSKKAISNLLTYKTLLNVTSITRSGTTVTVTVGATTPHGLKAGDLVTIGGTTQTGYNGKWAVLSTGLTTTVFTVTVTTTPTASPATGAYYVSNVTIDAENSLAEAGRYKDASKLITANRQEIIDRAFAEIAVQYTEAGWGTNWVVPGDTVTTNLSRYFDAYRLIQKNKQIIIETAYATVVAFPPSPAPTDLLNKCKRDIGYFVDAVSLDLLLGSVSSSNGNKYTRKFLQQYFNAAGNALTSDGLAGEVTQSNTAFNKASDAMNASIKNLLSSLVGVVTSSPAGGTWQDGSTGTKTVYTDLTISPGPATYGGGGGNIANTGFNACADVTSAINSLTLLVTSSLTGGSITSLVAESNGVSEGAGELKCMRDLGYMIDSVAQDLFWGGNEFTIDALKEYFGNNGGSLNGEISQSVIAFNAARDMVKKALTNQLYTKTTLSAGPAVYGGAGGNIIVGGSGNAASCTDVQATVDTLFGIVSTTLNAGTLTALPPLSNGQWDCANVRSTLDTLFAIPTSVISAGSLAGIPASNPGLWSQVSEASKCKRDIGYFVEAIVSDFRLGGNENTVNAAESYFTGTGNASITGTLSALGVVTGISNTSSLQVGMSVSKTSGTGVFGDNAVISVVGANQVTIAISSGSFTAGSITFTANQLDYIQNERVETLDAYSYVKQIMISSMRNHNTYIPTGNVSFSTASSTVTLTGGKTTDGLVVGMKVQSVTTIPVDTGSNALTNYNDALEEVVGGRVVPKSTNVSTRISSETYIKRIISSTEFELGERGSKLTTGLTKKPFSNSTANLFFSYDEGVWSSAIDPSVDNSVIQVYNEYSALDGECSNIKNTLDTYFAYINTIINNGIGQVARIPSTLNTGTFAQRATLFTLTNLDGTTTPHFLQTGTPVRLVPKAKDGATVDKRLIRLPRGFDTNTVYYVIAPGRITDPYDYSTKTAFNASAGSLQNLMLATSIENAAAGIFIYSSETESIDPNIQIDIYQYLLDLKYDLNKYEVTVKSSGTGTLERLITSEPHVFDAPTSSDTLTDTQKYTSVFFKPISGGLPSLSIASGGGQLNPNVEYFVKYVSKYEFLIYDTLSNAINNPGSPLTFTSGFTNKFYVLSNKRRSPLKFDPTANTAKDGTWYLMTDTSKNNSILARIRADDFAQKDKTPDSWFERLSDTRETQDRVYRLRYVIPNYLRSVRDPLRGFIIKGRTDSTRKLLPQKILLKPTGVGNTFAQLSITNSTAAAPGFSAGQEYLGLNILSQGPDFVSAYDAYNPLLQDPTQPLTSPPKYRIKITTNAQVTFYVQSAKKRTISNKDYLELTVFDVGIEAQGYKQKIFTSVEITPPQGGNGAFISNISNTATDTGITWTGATEGSAKVHAYYNYEGKHYLILKDVNTITSTLEYSPFTTTTFTQGLVSAKLLSEPDFGRSSTDRYLYVTEGANVYTMTPGDTLSANNGTYTIASVEDVQDFEDTFYIYDINTIRRRIYGQQDGIYYLTCVKGNVSPYPTGSGVGENFRGYKFSQPISKLYPEFYKDDPEWYKQIDSTLIDPPASVSAADNYIHGLVTVNDSKSSITREAVLDFVKDPGSRQYQFSGILTSGGTAKDVSIKALEGTASAGSEGRKIPISGNSLYPTENRLYVELRRPSIARSGNHTFEYLGFGPGNYSTGFPLRQEVVLSDVQDFYAQAKRENGGIVFYTGLNSNGDLYIGNRKINAITGEETYLESAALVASSDEGDTIGNFVTTFDGPVTFNDKVSFLAADNNKWPILFNAPIRMEVVAYDTLNSIYAPSAIEVVTNLRENYDDATLSFNSQTGRETGNITLSGNRITSAIYQFNGRGIQNYSIRTATTNTTPNQLNPYGSQSVDFGIRYPLVSGDILLKGKQVGTSGSLGWIYANNFTTISHAAGNGNDKYSTLVRSVSYPANVVRINWAINLNTSIAYTNSEIGITSSSYSVRISGQYSGAQSSLGAKTLGTWPIYAATFSINNTYIDIQLTNAPTTGTYLLDYTSEPNVFISYSINTWKEVGVIGSESIRTETDTIGNYKLGINTVARAANSAYLDGFVDPATTNPRANLDLVGNAFISGKSINFATKVETGLINAFLIGGNSSTPNNVATLRVDTLNNRFGINTTSATLDRTFVVIGDARITGDFMFESDINVNGGDITTTVTSNTFNFLNQITFTGTSNISNYASAINIGTSRTGIQTLNIGNSSTNSTVRIGNNTAATASNVSKVNIGGAFNNNESNSYVSFDSKLTRVAGDLSLGYFRGIGETTKIIVPTGASLDLFSAATTVDLATNASTIRFGGQGGNTTIRNSLTVDASLLTKGNITLQGGLASFNFTGTRAQMGTPSLAWTGQSAAPVEKPVDLVTVVNGIVGNATYYINEIDTPGNGDWGGTGFQDPVVAYSLPALTGNQYYLPLKNASVYAEGDYLLINTTVISGRNPEIVKIPVGGLVRTSVIPYYIIVERQPLGTFIPIKTNHPDTTSVVKLNIALDATWVTNNLNSSTGTAAVNLAEFGGTLSANDYVIVQRTADGTAGEVIKIQSYSVSDSRKLTVNNGATPAVTMFSVDSTTGNTIVGDANTPNTGNLTIYGSLNLAGGCGNGSTTTDRKLTFRNELYETVNINTCTGDAIFGSQYATVFTVGGYFGSTKAAHTTTDPVYVYRNDPFAIQQLGPGTTLANPIATGTFDIPVQSISGFSKGDLVLITNGTTQAEFILITAAPYVSGSSKFLPTIYNAEYPAGTYPNGGRAQETTSKQAFPSGSVVIKVQKDTRTTTLAEAIPASGRTIVELPNTNSEKIRMRLVNGDLISPKLDNAYLVRIGSEFFYPDSWSGNVDNGFNVRLSKGQRMVSSTNLTPTTLGSGYVQNYFGGGKLTVYDDITITSGGNLRMLGSDGQTLIFSVANDDGHSGDGSIIDEFSGRDGMYLNGAANIYGKLKIYQKVCQENGVCSEDIKFQVYNNTGAVIAGASLTINGQVTPNASGSTPILDIKNLGSAGSNLVGPKRFTIYQDGSIDAFGITQYYTANGGRRWTYVAQSSTGLGQTQANPLQPNNNYLLNCTSGGNMVLYLPATATTGDTIRFLEISGNLTYNTSLIIRALKVGGVATALQGDSAGSKANAGSGSVLTTAWDSGELIVQTRNASFGLIYVGVTDAPNDPAATEIPANLRGWWLTEL